jgi:hypothetical protein
MASKARTGKGSSPIWTHSKFNLWSRRWVDPDDRAPTVVLLRHPAAPFTQEVDAVDDPTMRQVAFAYLERANKLEPPDIESPLDLPETWLRALHPKPAGADKAVRASFGWLKIGWPPPKLDERTSVSRLVSFRAERGLRGATLPDQTVILLASELLDGECIGSDFGIRVVMHVHQADKTTYVVRITGMSASLPFGHYAEETGRLSEHWKRRAIGLLAPEVRREIECALGLRDVVFTGFRLGRIEGDRWQIERRGTGIAKAPRRGKAVPHSFVHVASVSDHGKPAVHQKSACTTLSARKYRLVADATAGHGRVFPIDPASQGGAKGVRKRRPTRSAARLDHFRVDAKITAGRNEPLVYPPVPPGPRKPKRVAGDMEVLPCPRFVRADRGQHGPETIDLSGSGPAIRSNDFAAVMAYWNVKALFQWLEAYGIDAQYYFRMAKLPLKVAYRSGIEPGPGKDGQTVNARVSVDGWRADAVGPVKLGDRPSVEIHCALANRSRRERKPWNRRTPSPVEPLGIAADARWMCHEIGHVLLMASVGELEFRFAHSAGDALAAIVMDPRSELASDPNWRGATFPWVFIPRRHDRCVSHGWSWSGLLHHELALVTNTAPPRRKGYLSEQILSSSLFRLYLCLGGDTLDARTGEIDRIARESASHYAVYLIIRGTQILGTSGVVIPTDPDEFVSALIDADISTGKWDVKFPPRTGSEFHRIGGCVHKVIRWAFEAQGMYGEPGRITNGPGHPPPVDIYIEDRRPLVTTTPYGDIGNGPGSYAPVSLDWNGKRRGDATPAWQANAAAIDVQGDDIYVKVGNRGGETATGVTVSVWWHKWPAGTDAPTWDGGKGWTLCDAPAGAGQTIGPHASTTFGPFPHRPPRGRYLVLAQATCADDRANTDPATGLPCSQLATPLIDLVANDNNLGLRVLG